MYQETKVSLTIAINKAYKDKLRIMAAEQNLLDQDRVTSASTIAKEIICGYLDNLKSEEKPHEVINR
jgi:hypothetical protein